MLNGIDPIIIFQFSKLVTTDGDPLIPVALASPIVVDYPPIPIYLSETLTGIYIDSEDKNVDLQTETETLTNGEAPDTNQKGIGSTVSINLVAKKNSIGLTLLSAMIDLLFEKVTSKEYAITYLHGATTVFRGLLQSYSVNQNASSELMTIKIDLTRGTKQPTKPNQIVSVPGSTGTLPGG